MLKVIAMCMDVSSRQYTIRGNPYVRSLTQGTVNDIFTVDPNSVISDRGAVEHNRIPGIPLLVAFVNMDGNYEDA
jgi:hypothetical protein